MPILIAIALHAEARPVIDRFKLKQDASFVLPVFRRNEIWMTVTGMGRMKSAIATTSLIAQIDNGRELFIFNLGIAGHTQMAGEGPVTIGDRFLVNKITDQVSGRFFYPDLLPRTPLSESTVTTVEFPLDQANAKDVEPGLVDMEASGFYQAAATFLPPHRIGCIKIVADHLETQRLDKNYAGSLVAGSLEEFEETITAYQKHSADDTDVLTDTDVQIVNSISKRLRLTTSRHGMLLNLIRSYKLHTRAKVPELSEFTRVTVRTKQEGESYFEQVRRILSVE